jgi:hypothetical protein
MQINESKIAFICFLLFVRIGAFQWVTANPNKKSFPVSHCISNVATALSLSPVSRWPSREAADSGDEKIQHAFGFS